MATKRQKEKRAARYTSAKGRAEKHESGFTPTALNIPDGINMFSFKKAGVYRLDIMPYIVGKGNPYAEEGDLHYERTYFTHRGVGPEQNSYVCLRRTYKKPCPICEHAAMMRRDPNADLELIKEHDPKERQLWIVKDMTAPDRGFQLLDISFHLFGKILDAKIKDSDEEDGFDKFFHLEDGLTLKLSVVEDSFGSRTFYKVTNIEMKPRAKNYEEDILEEIPCLDEVPKELSYKELKNLFEETASDEDGQEEEEEAPKKRGKPSRAAKEEEEEEPEEEEEDGEEAEDEDDVTAEDLGIEVGSKVKHKKHGVCTVKHVSGDGSSLRLEDEDGNEHRAVAPSTCEIVDEEEDEGEDEEEEKPAAKKGRGKTKPDKKSKKDEEEEDDDEEPDEDEDEEEDEEEEEEPVKKGKAKKKEKEEEDEEEEWDDEEWDDEEEEAPKKKPRK